MGLIQILQLFSVLVSLVSGEDWFGLLRFDSGIGYRVISGQINSGLEQFGFLFDFGSSFRIKSGNKSGQSDRFSGWGSVLQV